jgi:hypothetical protein
MRFRQIRSESPLLRSIMIRTPAAASRTRGAVGKLPSTPMVPECERGNRTVARAWAGGLSYVEQPTTPEFWSAFRKALAHGHSANG